MPPTAGSSTAEARFLFDLASPSCWLVAERILQVMPVATEWVPVHVTEGPVEGEAFRCATEEEIFRSEIERRARALELQPVRWPEPFPFDSAFAMRAATYAKATGRTVAFSLAAFRQAFCGGRALDEDAVLIAAAACELHPRALAKAVQTAAVKDALREATDRAGERGVSGVPALVVDGEVFWGDDRLEEAVAAAS